MGSQINDYPFYLYFCVNKYIVPMINITNNFDELLCIFIGLYYLRIGYR